MTERVRVSFRRGEVRVTERLLTRAQINVIREAMADRAPYEMMDKTGKPFTVRPKQLLRQSPGTIPDWYLVEVE